MENKKNLLIMLPIAGLMLTTTLVGCGNNTPGGNETSNELNTPNPSLGYVKLDNLSITSPTYNDQYPDANGKLNVLCIPVELDDTGYEQEHWKWDATNLAKFKKMMFGNRFEDPQGYNTMKSYYETASFDNIEIDGMVTSVFKPTDPNLTMKAINEDPTSVNLHLLLEKAGEFAMSAHPEVNWSDYDLNNDGRFDAVHVITNAPSQKYLPWGDPLWPHMGYTNVIGTPDHPKVDVYSVSSLGHFTDARTQIHEQGHMIGLEDYYDYPVDSYTAPVSYIGKADMQDSNTFDWNSFSKMSVGWVKPYVIDGSKDVTTITMKAASINGDCLVIPADFSTYNQSAFDEYFLIELFSPFGNNEYDWNRCYLTNYDGSIGDKIDYGEYGVKMYHVDARLWAYEEKSDNLYTDIQAGHAVKDKKEVEAALAEGKEIVIGTNNSLSFTSYAYPGVAEWGDYRLLSLIQRGDKNNNLAIMGGYMDENDLFRQGDIFKFSNYNKQLLKTTARTKKMDKGETFPYEIEFKKMSKEEVTIEVRKVK